MVDITEQLVKAIEKNLKQNSLLSTASESSSSSLTSAPNNNRLLLSKPKQVKGEFLKKAYIINSNVDQIRFFLECIKPFYVNSRFTEKPNADKIHLFINQSRLTIKNNKKNSGHLPPNKDVNEKPEDEEDIEEILEEEEEEDHQIAMKSLGTILKSLLEQSSLTKLSSQQREHIDMQIKLFLSSALKQIENLEKWDMSTIVSSNNQSGEEVLQNLFSSLADENLAAKENLLLMHKESVCWCLTNKLNKVSEMMEEQQRLHYRKEISKNYFRQKPSKVESITPVSTAINEKLNTTSPNQYSPSKANGVLESPRSSTLSPQEQLSLEQENENLLREFESDLDQIRQAQSTITEIASLHGTIADHLQMQSTTIESLYNDAIATTDNVKAGNRYLISAQNNAADSRLWILFFLVMSSLVLLFLDWYD